MRLAIEIIGLLVIGWALIEGLRAMGRKYSKGSRSEDRPVVYKEHVCDQHPKRVEKSGKPTRKPNNPTPPQE